MKSKIDQIVDRMDALVKRFDDIDPRTREQKIRDLAARPGTKGEGEAARSALTRINVKPTLHKTTNTVRGVLSERGWQQSIKVPGIWRHPNHKGHHIYDHGGGSWDHFRQGKGETPESLRSHLSNWRDDGDEEKLSPINKGTVHSGTYDLAANGFKSKGRGSGSSPTEAAQVAWHTAKRDKRHVTTAPTAWGWKVLNEKEALPYGHPHFRVTSEGMVHKFKTDL